MSEKKGIRREVLKAVAFIALGFLIGALTFPFYGDFKEGFKEGYDAARVDGGGSDGGVDAD